MPSAYVGVMAISNNYFSTLVPLALIDFGDTNKSNWVYTIYFYTFVVGIGETIAM